MSRTLTATASTISTPAPTRRITSSEVVEPAKLSAEARAALVEELYATHCQIFDGVERDAFVRYVVDSHAAHTWIQIHRDEDGRLVGYFAMHIHEHSLRGETIAIIRSELGVLREFRGQRASGSLMVDKGIRYALRHPLRPIYLLCSPIHPASYAMLHRYYGHIWPRPEAETPAPERALMEALAHDFHLEPVRPDDLYVRHVGWRTRETETDRAFWARRDDASVRFFLERNPDYGEGQGLLTLMPGHVWRGLFAMARIVRDRLRRAARGLMNKNN